MAMIIAWQTINAVPQQGSRKFTRGFLVVTPGVTIRDRLRVLQPNDPDSYYASRELVPNDMLRDLERAKIVIPTTTRVPAARDAAAVAGRSGSPGSKPSSSELGLLRVIDLSATPSSCEAPATRRGRCFPGRRAISR